MKIGIVGRPHVGKTTVFNALAHANAAVGGYTRRQQINLSTVSVPDERLERLAAVFQPKKITPATIDYVDVAGTSRALIHPEVEHPGRAELDAEILGELRTVDALAHVVRFFEDAAVPHVDGSVNGIRDIEAVELEFVFADLRVIEGRLGTLSKQLQNEKSPALQSELRLLAQCQQALENGKPLRTLSLAANEEKLIRGYGFLTQKPSLLICNIGEAQLDETDEILKRLARYEAQPHTAIIVLAAQLEMEIAQLDAPDAEMFMAEMGLNEPALEMSIQTSYRLLGLITFFSGNTNEVRAWTLRAGRTAVEAAGVIHTDFERGFIRSECISWADLVACGSYASARSKGLLRVEGKTYQVQEGDVLTILANLPS